MEKVYQDNDIFGLYARALIENDQPAGEGVNQETLYYRTLFERTSGSLETLCRTADPSWDAGRVILVEPTDGNPAKDVFVDWRGVIHIGQGFIADLDLAVMIYTGYLVKNYQFQIAPLMGEAPSLSQVVTPEDFPLEALRFHAKHLIRGAVAEDGYEKRPFQSIMEFVQKLSLTNARPEELSALLSRALAKKNPLDIHKYMDKMDTEQLISSYLDEDTGSFFMRLHHQLMLDALFFVLAHEIAHVLLGHYRRFPGDQTQLRQEEAKADVWGLNLLKALSGFELRSLLALFGFVQLFYPTEITSRLDHPFSRDRMMILCATVMQDKGEEFRADVNAGLSMLTRPLVQLASQYTWEDGTVEEFVVTASCYSDMDYGAHLLLSLERAPHQVEMWDGPRENALLLHQLSLEAKIILRDRVHPEKIYHQGVVRYRPGFSPEDWEFHYDKEKNSCRQHARFISLPYWWLEHPDTVLDIRSLDFASEPLPDEENIQSDFIYDFGLTRFAF